MVDFFFVLQGFSPLPTQRYACLTSSCISTSTLLTFAFSSCFLPCSFCAPSVQVHNLEHPCMSHKYSNRVQGNTGSSSSREWGTWLVWCNS